MLFKRKNKLSLPKKVDKRSVAAIAPRLMVPQWDHMIVNNDYVRMLVVTDWPNYMHLNWAEIFMMIGDVCVPVTLSCKKIPNIKTLINYSANDTKWGSHRINETMVDREQRQYEADQAKNAAMLISRANTTFFETYLYLKVVGQDKETLEKNTNLVINRLTSYGITAQAIYSNQMQSFWAASPFQLENPVVDNRYNFSAPALAISRGLWNREIGVCDEVGIPLGHDDMGGICRLNMTKNTFVRPNGNIEFIGESGSGKTASLSVLIVYLYLMFDCRIIINDVEGEFVHLTKMLGGKVSTMSASSAMLISPFEPRNFGASASADNEDEAFDYFNEDDEVAHAKREAMQALVLATHLPFITQFLLKAFTLPQAYKNIVYDACHVAYYKYGIKKKTTFDEYYQKKLKYPCLTDVYEALAFVQKMNRYKVEDINDIRNSFHKAVNGPEEHLWVNGESQLKDSPLMCIDMQAMSSDPNMREAQYYNLLTWEWTQITTSRYSDKKTIIISDELQTSFKASNTDFCEKYADMVRRARKYGAMIVSVLQEAAAFSGEEIKDYGRSINSNSAYKFFGTTEEDDNVETVKKLLNATKDTMDALKKTRRGRFLLKIGTERQCWVNIEYDPWIAELRGKGGGE